MEIAETIRLSSDCGVYLAALGKSVEDDVLLVLVTSGIMVLAHYFGKTIPKEWSGFRIMCYFSVIGVIAMGAGILDSMVGADKAHEYHVFWVAFICTSLSSVSGLIIGFSVLDRKQRDQESLTAFNKESESRPAIPRAPR